MSIFTWIALGLVSGFIASKIVKGRGQGLFRDLALGVVGAVVGGGALHLLRAPSVTGFNPWSVFVSVVGAALVLVAYHGVSGRRAEA